MTRCHWCDKDAEEAAAQHEGPHATWCVHFREEQRGGPASDLSESTMRDALAELQQQRNRPAEEPGGCQCQTCDEVFIGAEWHTECGICHAKREFAVAMRKAFDDLTK